MERRHFIRLIGGGSVLAATSLTTGCVSSQYPAQAVEAWNGPAAAETDPRRRALAYAITAPNPHNLQPWLVDLREANVITVYTDAERVLPETDPFGRQILVGHGAFLELLVIALSEQGIAAQVALWPQGELPAALKDWKTANRPVARLTLQAGASKDALFAQILKRHTAKTAFDTTRSVSAAELAKLTASVQPGNIRIGASIKPEQIQQLRSLCLDSAKREFGTPQTMLETMRLLRVGPSEILQNRDGVSINAPMIRVLNAFGMVSRTEAPAIGSTSYNKSVERYEAATSTAMGFVWLSGENTRTAQLQAGRAYVRLQLQATAQGISMHPLSQALQEFKEMRPFYEQVHQALLGKPAPASPQDETVQMFCRIGYSNEAASATPRRVLSKFVKSA